MEQKNKKLVTCYSSLVTDSKGFTLIELAIILVVIGILIALGAGLVGILTKQAKLRESREIVAQAKEAVLGFVVKNKRLPTLTEFPSIVRNKDAWGNDLFYYPDNPGLTSGDACCSTSTGFTVNDRGTPKTNVAFILLSMGENGTNNTGTTPTFTIQDYSDSYDDLVQYVTIDELKDKVLSCQSLEISTTTLPEAEEDTPYFTKIIGKGGCNPSFSLQSGTLPTGLNLSSDGTISGTVNQSTTPAGTLNTCFITDTFTVRLSASGLNPVDKNLSIITKPQTLRITNASDLPSGTVGGAYSATLYGAGGRNSYSWSISSGSLPPGLTLNSSTGIISGQATTAGTYNFVVALSDTCNTTSKAFTINISTSGGGGGGCPALSLNPASGTSWSINVGDSLNQTITVSGGQSPYTNTQCTPATCNGLSLSCTNNNATISGTASAPGTCTFDIAWQDSCTNPGPQTISGTYTVNIVCTPFTGWGSSLPAANNCQSYSGSITVVGGVPAYTWALSSGSLPNGINFCTGNTSSTCNLTGNQVLAPPQTYNFTVQVTDSCTNPGQQSTSQGFSITVNLDSCYAGGISLRNQSGATRYYRKNGGVNCTPWATTVAASITVLPDDLYLIYSNNTCTTLYCANPVTYCQQKPYDTNGNCQTRMNAGCAFADR